MAHSVTRGGGIGGVSAAYDSRIIVFLGRRLGAVTLAAFALCTATGAIRRRRALTPA